MSLTTKAIGIAKKMRALLSAPKTSYLSPVRRINRISTDKRICAMTFDDGPFKLPPSSGGTKPLTLHLVEVLEKYGAHGTFDVIGDTSANYPDTAGKEGSPEWGGLRHDHYPDINKDKMGGAVNCPDLIRRIIDGGHELTNHTYSHVLFGRKNVIYGRRSHFTHIGQAIDDVNRLHNYISDTFGYEMSLSRPPHYVDKISGGYSSYDVYAATGYQYLGASYDGAGWLPLPTYDMEVEAMWKGLERDLEENPDLLCGQIIFQKDGYNMARRTPVADGLEIQLSILQKHGYKVVTVSDLLKISPFTDIDAGSPIFNDACRLLDKGLCICYDDNTIRPDSILTRAELAQIFYGKESILNKITSSAKHKTSKIFNDLKPNHPYAGAVMLALQSGALKPSNNTINPNSPVTGEEFRHFITIVYGKCDLPIPEVLTHAGTINLLAKLVNFT